MAEKKSFIIYDNWAKLLYDMPVEQAGKLIKAICGYKLGECESTGDAVLDAVFGMIKEQLDKDDAKYAEICVKRSNAGKSKKQQTNDIKCNQVLTNDIKTEQLDTDNDKNIDKDNKGKKPKAFTPPTLEEIQAYIKERGSNVDAKRFFDYYEQGGWKDSSGKPVRNWKQKMIAVWEKDKPVQPKPQNSFCNFKQNDIDYDELAKKIYAN